MPPRVSKDSIIADVQRLAEDLDHAPTTSELKEEGEFSLHSYYKYFDGIDDLVRSAGLEPTKRERIRYTRDDLIAELSRLSEEFDRTPTTKLMNKQGQYSVTVYQSRFGSWNAALDAAGMELNCPIDVDANQLLSDLQEVAEKLNRPPTRSEYVEHGEFSAEPFKRVFGGHNDALREAELSVPKRQGVPSEDLVKELVRVADQIGRSPTFSEMEEWSEFYPSIYPKRFGSWNGALEAAGLDRNPVSEKVPRPELLSNLEMIIEKLGHPPTQNELENVGEFSMMPYNREFGGLNAAVREVGYEPRNPWGEDRGGRYYGPNWAEQRRKRLKVDGRECRVCGTSRDQQYLDYGRDLSVHHIEKFDSFDSWKDANKLSNLVTVCTNCHRRVEGKPKSFFENLAPEGSLED